MMIKVVHIRAFVASILLATSPLDAAVPQTPQTTPTPQLRATPSPHQGQQVYIPQWKVGESWSVECDVPNFLLAKTPPWISNRKMGQDPRPRWTFRVEKMTDVGGKLRLFFVRASGSVPTMKAGADLVFAGRIEPSGKVGSLFLYKAEYRYPMGQGVNTLRKDYNKQSAGPFPVINDSNDIPSDFPYLDATFAPAGSNKVDGVWKEFVATDIVAGDLRDRSVRQTIVFEPSKMQFGEELKVPVDRSLNQDVYMKLLGQRHTIRLVFNPSYPWPVYGEGPRGKFWFVK